MPSDADDQKNKAPDELSFNFIKSAFYRNIHADGIFGSLTPRTDLYMAFFSERIPLPQQTTHAMGPSGLGPEKVDKRVVTKNTIERELEVGITMSLTVARSVARWLQSQVDEADRLMSEAKKEKENDLQPHTAS